ncbi:hypothetical protein C8F04DRAFT_1067178, partial [Mycena alexandri]
MSLEVLSERESSATQSSVNLNRSLDFSHLITSNNLPLDSDIPFIRAIVRDGEIQVDALNEQIHDLVQRRDRAAEHVRQHRAIISPVRRLPPELLCEIFELSFNDKGPPWHLGHICRSWRHTALSHPPLWSSIAISTSSLENMTSIQTQLLRSANAPLDIYWWNDPIDHDAHSSWSDLVLPYSRRWRTLHVHNYGSRVGGLDWLRPVKGRLDQLKELITTRCYVTEMQDVDVFATAPNLRRAILSEADFTYGSPPISITWGQITHYRGVYTPERQMEILSAAQDLLFCELGFVFATDVPFDSSTTPIILPRLRGLSLEMIFLLSQFTTPVLETLILHDGGSLYLSVLPPFIQRSSCTLNKLVLKQCAIGPELIPVLRDLPALVYLLLEHTSGSIPKELFKA